jgi:Transglutaminase-like superfamily
VTRLFVQSYLVLAWAGVLMRCRSLKHVLRHLEKVPPFAIPRAGTQTAAAICQAIDLACAFYPVRVLCLQRSIATALLMRRNGIGAELVLGARLLPFKSHAWVEVNGVPVNDKPYMREIYEVLDTAVTLR